MRLLDVDVIAWLTRKTNENLIFVWIWFGSPYADYLKRK